MMLTRRLFITVAGGAALGVAALALGGCGGPRGAAAPSRSAQASGSVASSSAVGQQQSSVSTQADASSSAAPAQAGASEALVVYFSHAGENYGVGVVEEGNTAIVAKMVAESTGAELFEVVPSKAYPEGYDECCDVALAEQNEGARPAYANDIDISPYNTVYLGYPIWWGDLPMCLYTFLEAHDWAGKDIRPFCTHAGSGLSGTEASLQETCAGANVGEGLALSGTTAQNSRDEARSAVASWLE